MIHYVCKYTPVELFRGFKETCAVLEEMPENFEQSDQIAHANLCGFGKSVIQAVLEGKVEELVLVNCCDSMRRVYDIVKHTGKCRFLAMLDLPHDDRECEKLRFAGSLRRLKEEYEAYSGKIFDRAAFLNSFEKPGSEKEPYIGVLGVRVSGVLEHMIRENMRMKVENLTCTGGRKLAELPEEMEKAGEEALFLAYADVLLTQMPCFRMNRSAGRNALYLDPDLKGIIYHTIKFCDYYGFEYASVKKHIKVPLLKIETDFTSQSAGQLLTRIQAFSETIEGSESMDAGSGISEEAKKKMESGVYYVAGIDSGSTSTDVVILYQDVKIKATMIIPTGGGAMMSAEKSLELAVEKAGIQKDAIVRIVTTGYGRAYIDSGDDSITEITCHAKGAHYLNPNVRTVIDIGGQDIKAISIDEHGAVKNFLMNDKCAAGTGRFLEMMARTLGLSLQEMSTKGLEWKENIVISSMCTVFAESEVVSLVAQNKDVADIVHGLNVSVASKVGALAARLGKNQPGEYMMTGGVAQNQGIIKALEEKLGAKLYICKEAQLCGALGAALFAYEKCKGEEKARE
ncbi:MAG: acyl-CoA dehydratase activase [Lachnospiraceae bacterium]|nr:acyl-CoA dehydratase activase [Lachnospiraceae bacterium]